MASEKQVGYIMHLLDRAGYGTRYMDSRFKALGAKMRERSGRVDEWVRGLTVQEASHLIEQLKSEAK